MNQEMKILGGITVGTLILLFGAVFFLSGNGQQVAGVSVDATKLETGDSHKIAAEGAKLTIVEFADYQCPACAAAQPGLKKALEEYKGRVSFVYRHFPLTQHGNARIAAVAAEAAGEQGKFWEMSSLLYETQGEWSEVSDPKPLYETYAQRLQLEQARFKTDLRSDKYETKITQDVSDGAAVGVNGTPTFFFNGVKYKGGLSYENFKQEIEKNLSSN